MAEGIRILIYSVVGKKVVVVLGAVPSQILDYDPSPTRKLIWMRIGVLGRLRNPNLERSNRQLCLTRILDQIQSTTEDERHGFWQTVNYE